MLAWQVHPFVASLRASWALRSEMRRVATTKTAAQVPVANLWPSARRVTLRYVHMNGYRDYSEVKALRSTYLHEGLMRMVRNFEDMLIIALFDDGPAPRLVLHESVELGCDLSVTLDGTAFVLEPER